MTEGTKRTWDVVLALLTMAGAIVAFAKTIHEWRVSQKWKQAEHLDKLIDHFETQPLLRLSCSLLDWTFRSVKYEDQIIKFTNGDLLLALRDHVEDKVTRFEGNQAIVRDCLDALLGFLSRLQTAIETRVVELAPARRHFEYWVKKLVAMDSHAIVKDDPDFDAITQAFGERSPSAMVARYIDAYSDASAFHDLCVNLNLQFPELDAILTTKRASTGRRKALASSAIQLNDEESIS